MNEVILNTATNNPGFEQLAAWGYSTPAAVYFWAGIGLVLAGGLLGLGFRWVARITVWGSGD